VREKKDKEDREKQALDEIGAWVTRYLREHKDGKEKAKRESREKAGAGQKGE
jgi:hypothetical protein